MVALKARIDARIKNADKTDERLEMYVTLSVFIGWSRNRVAARMATPELSLRAKGVAISSLKIASSLPLLAMTSLSTY